MTNPTARSFRRRPSAGKTIFRWVEYSLFLLATVVLGYVFWVQAETFAFQAYQSWRLDQMQQGKPASVVLFVKQWIPGPWKRDDAPEVGQATPMRPTEIAAGPASDASASHASDGLMPAQRTQGATPSRTGKSILSPPPARPSVNDGTLIGRLQIPRLGLSAIVLEGLSARTLRLAVGHMPGTALPGQPGNVSLSAHRDTFFRGLRNIQRGDLITLSTVNGDVHRYRVGAVSLASPNNTEVLDAYSGPGINLITCYPFYYVGPAPKRFIVHGDESSDSVVKQAASPASVQPHPVSINESSSN